MDDEAMSEGGRNDAAEPWLDADGSEPTVVRKGAFDPDGATERPHDWGPLPTVPAQIPKDAKPATRPRDTRQDWPLLRRSLLLTVASTILPGSGLLGARVPRLRLVGLIASVVSLAAVLWLGIWALTDLPSLARFAQAEATLASARFVLGAVTVAWVALIALTQIATRPPRVDGNKRAVGAALVAALAFGVAAPTAVAAQYSRDADRLLDTVLPQASEIRASGRETIASNAPDPWAGTPRVNILLLGADGDASRAERIEQFGVRTDTIMVASIDTRTGNTTLIQIPRNLPRTPFPEGSVMAEAFPDGFRGEGDPGNWYVNGIWEKTEEGGDYEDLFAGSTFPGAEALKEGVQGITGLEISRFVMLDIDGLRALIDAMGGVTINVNRDLPIGGSRDAGIRPHGTVERGKARKLDGYNAMWYARSRYDSSDYDRMARQSCLVDAIINQANPETLLTSFEPIAAASAQILTTDVTRDEFGAFIDLAFRVKDKGKVNRLVFAPGKNGYSPNRPDFDEMHAAVQTAIAEPVAPTARPTVNPPTSTPLAPSPTPTQQEGGDEVSPSPTEPGPTPTRDEQLLQDGSQNVGDACAWQGD